MEIKKGFYKHYKGGLYFVLGTGKHTETEQLLVFYYSLFYFTFWARPANMWHDWVQERYAWRFEKISIFTAIWLLAKKLLNKKV